MNIVSQILVSSLSRKRTVYTVDVASWNFTLHKLKIIELSLSFKWSDRRNGIVKDWINKDQNIVNYVMPFGSR